MINSNTLETLTKTLSDRLPSEFTAIKEEVEKNFKSISFKENKNAYEVSSDKSNVIENGFRKINLIK